MHFILKSEKSQVAHQVPRLHSGPGERVPSSTAEVESEVAVARGELHPKPAATKSLHQELVAKSATTCKDSGHIL